MTNELQVVESKVPAIVAEARALTVNSNEDYERAAQFVRTVTSPLKAQIKAACAPVKEAAFLAHKAAVAQEQKLLQPVEQAEAAVKSQLGAWARRLEEARRAEEDRLRKEARERAEREALERAVELERQGHREEAEAIIEQPVEAPPVILPDERPRVEGISIRSVWRFRVVDKSKIAPQFLMPDEKAIGQIVRSLKGAAVSVVGAGIEVYEDKSVAG